MLSLGLGQSGILDLLPCIGDIVSLQLTILKLAHPNAIIDQVVVQIC